MKLPEEHWNWTHHVSQECIEIEILELAKLAASGKKVIVDTNIPPDATLKNFNSWALYHLPVEIDWIIPDFLHIRGLILKMTQGKKFQKTSNWKIRIKYNDWFFV